MSSPPGPRGTWLRGRLRWQLAAVVCFVVAIVLSWTEGARDLRLEGLAFAIALVGCAAVLRAARRGTPPP